MCTEEQPLLDRRQARALLDLARDAIARALHLPGKAADPILDEPVFREKRAVFVTLTQKRALRGCIGSLIAVESLRDNAGRNAVQAALHDPRFPPLTPQELRSVRIEISVLSPSQHLEYNGAAQLLQLLEPGKDGLIVEGPNGARATFLPQVWEQLPQAEAFLSALCRKAGLAADAWKEDGLRYRRYRVESHEEHGQP